MLKTCYMCDSAATSKEHIPPKAIFPKAKDMGFGANYLNNLITVPSCDKHNTKKSGDDEYLVYYIMCHYQNNPKILKPLIQKMARASSRKSKAITDLLKEPMLVSLNGQETGSVKIDVKRANKCFEQMARGLYLHEYGKKWIHEMGVTSPSLRFITERNASRGNYLLDQMQKQTARNFATFDFKGENPQYFKYQIMPLFKEHGIELIIRLIFYEGMEVYVLSKEKWLAGELEIFKN